MFRVARGRAPPRAAAAQPVRLLDLPWQLSRTTPSSEPPARSSPGRERPVTVGIRDGRIATLDAEVAPATARGRASWPTTRCCCPGLVDTHVHVNEPGRTEWEGFAIRHPRRGRRRRDHDRRHAAQLDPADHHGGRAAGRSGPPPATRSTSTSASGAARCPGNLRRPGARCTTPACSASSASCCRLRRRGVPARSTPPGFGRRCPRLARLDALMIVHAEDGDARSRPAPHGRAYAGFLGSRPPDAPRSVAIGRVVAAAAGDRRPRPHRAPRRGAARCP